MDDLELLWRFYQENTVQGRHHEQQRTAVTSFFTAMAAASLTVIALDKCVTRADLPLAALLVATGIFGAALSAKQYERFRHHMRRAKAYRDELDRRLPGAMINALKVEADADLHMPSKMVRRWRLALLWVSLHALIAALGLVLALLSLGSGRCG